MKLLVRNKIFALLSLSRFFKYPWRCHLQSGLCGLCCQYAATEPSSWHCQSHCIYS